MLVVVDMQVGFLNANSLPIVDAVTHLIDACDAKSIPTAFTRFGNEIGSPYERLLGWTSVRQEQETALHEAFRRRDDPIIEKTFYSAFTPEFSALVSEWNCETLLICGVSTESCVLKTAVDAFERDLRPILVADSCASDLGPEMHRMGLEIIQVLIGKDQIMTTEELIRQL